MSRRGYPSTAHEYNARRECIHCHMIESNVMWLNHECTPERERITDEAEAKKAGMSVADWKLGNDLPHRTANIAKIMEEQPTGGKSGE